MKTKHPYTLRPYHNPARADESLVPPGWRMLYADEFPLPEAHNTPCRIFITPFFIKETTPKFGNRENCTGRIGSITYIIPVSA